VTNRNPGRARELEIGQRKLREKDCSSKTALVDLQDLLYVMQVILGTRLTVTAITLLFHSKEWIYTAKVAYIIVLTTVT